MSRIWILISRDGLGDHQRRAAYAHGRASSAAADMQVDAPAADQHCTSDSATSDAASRQLRLLRRQLTHSSSWPANFPINLWTHGGNLRRSPIDSSGERDAFV